MLSHHHKTVFVHIPKCAGQSVETAFLIDVGLTWDTRAPLLLRYNDMPELGPPRLAHLIARDYVRCRYVPQDMFDSYFRFAIVRNPWSRTVSLYRHLNFNMSFREFVTQWLADQLSRREAADQYWFVRPQKEFVQDNGKLLVNEILRFETLNVDFGSIAAATGLKTALPRVNKSRDDFELSEKGATPLRRMISALGSVLSPDRRERYGDWKEFYNDDTAKIVRRLYEMDVSDFDYSFDR